VIVQVHPYILIEEYFSEKTL